MKKLLLLILLLPLYVATSAQEFHIGAEGSRYVTDNRTDYWKGAVIGSYTRKLPKCFAFDVNASLYYQHYDRSTFLPNPGGTFYPETEQDYAHTFGGSIGVNGIIRLGGPISFFTGPMATCNFFQKDYIGGYTIDISTYRANLQWRLGLGADVWRLRVRASCDLYVTDLRYHQKGTAISVSVAYRL